MKIWNPAWQQLRYIPLINVNGAMGYDATIIMCESIFRQDDLSLKNYVMDLDGNVLSNEDEVMMVINYPFSKRSFIYANKP